MLHFLVANRNRVLIIRNPCSYISYRLVQIFPLSLWKTSVPYRNSHSLSLRLLLLTVIILQQLFWNNRDMVKDIRPGQSYGEPSLMWKSLWTTPRLTLFIWERGGRDKRGWQNKYIFPKAHKYRGCGIGAAVSRLSPVTYKHACSLQAARQVLYRIVLMDELQYRRTQRHSDVSHSKAKANSHSVSLFPSRVDRVPVSRW